MTFRRLLAAALFAAPSALVAQNATHGPIILRLPAGARTLALGNTGFAGRDDDVIFFNPAQLVNATGFSVSGEVFSSTSGTGALSAVTRFNGGGIGLAMRMANYELPSGVAPVDRRTMIEPGASPGMSAEVSVGLAQTIKGFRVGAVAKYAEELESGVRVGRPLGDVGVSKDWFRTTFALSVQNLGEDPDLGNRIVKLPIKTNLGFGHSRSVGPYDIFVTGAVSMLRDETVDASGGLEVNYSWLSGYNIAARVGGRTTAIGEEPFTAGAGFTKDRLSIDYALETLSNRRVGHRFGLRIR